MMDTVDLDLRDRLVARLDAYGRPVKPVDVWNVLAALADETHATWTVSRTDGEPMYGEYSDVHASGPDDWDSAEQDSEGYDDVPDAEPIEYRMRLIVPIVTHRRTYLNGVQRS